MTCAIGQQAGFDIIAVFSRFRASTAFAAISLRRRGGSGSLPGGVFPRHGNKSRNVDGLSKNPFALVQDVTVGHAGKVVANSSMPPELPDALARAFPNFPGMREAVFEKLFKQLHRAQVGPV